MENQINDLQMMMNQLHQQPSNHIEKVEYQFDQLKIETLEGTLNIGLTPSGSDSIEELDLGQNTATNQTEPETPVFRRIKENVEKYLDHENDQIFDFAEKQYNQRLDQTYRQFIIEDVRKQLNGRISYYVNKLKKEDPNLTEEQLEKLTIDKVTNDINIAIDHFIQNLPRKG